MTAIPYVLAACLLIAILATTWAAFDAQRQRGGRHRVEGRPPRPARQTPLLYTGAELPRRPERNQSLKDEICQGWRPYAGEAFTAQVEMHKDWLDPDEPTGVLLQEANRD